MRLSLPKYNKIGQNQKQFKQIFMDIINYETIPECLTILLRYQTRILHILQKKKKSTYFW